MANTYVLISGTTLGSNQTDFTFSSIPNTYTDLVLRCSLRSTRATFSLDALWISYNGNASTIYSSTRLIGTSTTAASNGITGNDSIYGANENAGLSTANTFTTLEFYLPSYTSAYNKCSFSFSAAETTTSTDNSLDAVSSLFLNTSAISSIKLSANGQPFAANSSFYLYGIKNTV